MVLEPDDGCVGARVVETVVGAVGGAEGAAWGVQPALASRRINSISDKTLECIIYSKFEYEILSRIIYCGNWLGSNKPLVSLLTLDLMFYTMKA
jgi:hypothetical protein